MRGWRQMTHKRTGNGCLRSIFLCVHWQSACTVGCLQTSGRGKAGGVGGGGVSNRGGTMDHRYGADIQGGSRAISGRSKQSSIYPARCGLPSMFLCLFVCLGLFLMTGRRTIDTWRHKQKREDIELQYKKEIWNISYRCGKNSCHAVKKEGGGAWF